jgi:hypothetical protein
MEGEVRVQLYYERRPLTRSDRRKTYSHGLQLALLLSELVPPRRLLKLHLPNGGLKVVNLLPSVVELLLHRTTKAND